jgi:uncharacterized membrane protein YhaH (DUF805 family)
MQWAPEERWYSPEGRIRRSTWVLRVLGAGLGMVLVVGGLAVLLPHSPERHDDGPPPLFMIPALVLVLGFVAFRFVQDVKRLHDLGRSGFWMVCAFIPVLNLFYLIMIVFADGQPYTNQYGPDPKGRGGSDIEDVVDVFR